MSSSARQRAAAFLLNMSERMNIKGDSTKEFNLPVLRQDISSNIGIAFETLSRVIQGFQKQ